MRKVETTLEHLKRDIGNFYCPNKHHFIVMNAVELNDKLEVQWFFSDYEPPYEVTAFFTFIQPEEEIPSIKEIISSAWVAEAELVDLIDVHIENTDKGFVLEGDSETAPLRKKK
jgi:hypothetical protein